MRRTLFHIAFLLVSLNVNAYSGPWKMQPVPIQTRWATEVSPNNVHPEYPRPQMVRKNWTNLNGLWEYAITSWDGYPPAQFDGEILVPFPIESALSGVQRALLHTQRLWYKRSISKPSIKNNERVLLHFGAIDWKAAVYLNGKLIGSHLGGYDHFIFDITASLKEGTNELIVSAYDPTNMGYNPHGKQTLRPRGILYTACSGIWQTVWMETVPSSYISSLEMTPDIDSDCLELKVFTEGIADEIEAIATTEKNHVSLTRGRSSKLLELSIPNPHLWSPTDPFLYQLTIRLLHKGIVIDSVTSYFGMRKIEVRNDDRGIPRLFLNNQYTFHLGVLDQGYWPEGIYTPPTDSALLFDIQTIKSMGFNTIRKHVKVESDRWYHYCDKEGILVWQDMITPSGYTYYAQAAFEAENNVLLTQLHNFPSIVIWVLFNEGWGSYEQERLSAWVKSKDSSRLLNAHSGANLDKEGPWSIEEKWIGSDMTDVHRYPGPGIAPQLKGKARVLGEWGGIRVVTPGHQWRQLNGWGYDEALPSEFTNYYTYMMKRLARYEKEGLSGAIYTQPYDVESEENGLMTYDRKQMKISIKEINNINNLNPHR